MKECRICYGKGHYPEDFDSFCFACMGSGMDPDWIVTFDLVVQMRYEGQAIGRRVAFRGRTLEEATERAQQWADRNLPEIKARTEASRRPPKRAPKPQKKKKRLVLRRKKG